MRPPSASRPWLIAAIVSAALPGCPRASSPETASLGLTLDRSADGSVVSLHAGDPLTIRLADAGDGGYSPWSISVPPDPAVLELTGQSHEPPTSGNAGDFGAEVFTFAARAPGKTELLIIATRRWSGEVLEFRLGVLVDATCAPSCEGKVCGSDGCFGNCGTCSAPASCADGACVGPSCTPSCEGRECGDDGCGGSCGDCPTTGSFVCDAGRCVRMCTLMACWNSISLALVDADGNEVYAPSGRLTDDSGQVLEFSCPSSPAGLPPYPGQPGAALACEQGVLQVFGPTPAALYVEAISFDGRWGVSARVDLTYAEYRPNGPDCGPVCSVATATVPMTNLAPPVDPAALPKACTDSGGTVASWDCCASAPDFPNLCLIGACGCGPGAVPRTICLCPQDECFNGATCVGRRVP